LFTRAYGQLARIYAREQNPAGIAATIERGIAVEPRSTQSLRLLESIAYEDIGDAKRSLAALEQAIPRGPFSKPQAILNELAARRRQLDPPR
jgi:hypothetical protein